MWMNLYLFASFLGFMFSLVGVVILAFDFQLFFIGKLRIEQVMLCALISIAASGVWLIADKQQKND